ncbi:serine hydroxymethyltransferase [Nonomuraea guangzhouensis]|uniref:Serine hydroxymethyltransferase n=1 Tax=Nonomuraea guangzhouensis TaxID=1291555 RepID=A0ABW4GGL2_9ACTN|nr:aminotransferase class I/II-fold pyridoxal phosphate-dependent enzyme [Nonomuraea guangzhouensis]
MTRPRPWVPAPTERLVQETVEALAGQTATETLGEIDRLVRWNDRIHNVECVNLNPATNVMNPQAEALLSAGLGTRASLGYAGEKYEMGLEAIERIEIIAAELAAQVFGAGFAEVRVGSGALANLYAFMATCRPGDTIIAPPASIGGHVTHHAEGAAGLYGLTTVPAPVAGDGYTVDLPALAELAERLRPPLITIGGSLNLFPHPIAAIREIADSVGARVLCDAAHMCGMLAGRVWPNPLDEGAHLITMSTYKSLGGPPGGLIVTNDAELAQRLGAIAYPGLTANFDPGRVAALAVTMLDWKVAGTAYAQAMVAAATRLAAELRALDVPVFAADRGATGSHQFAVLAHPYGGGQHAARLLRAGNLLACGIGLPAAPVAGDANGLRLGTPEIVRLGMGEADMPALASFIARALDGESVAAEVTAWRGQFAGVHFTSE